MREVDTRRLPRERSADLRLLPAAGLVWGAAAGIEAGWVAPPRIWAAAVLGLAVLVQAATFMAERQAPVIVAAMRRAAAHGTTHRMVILGPLLARPRNHLVSADPRFRAGHVIEAATASCVLALIALAVFIACAGDAGNGAGARLSGVAGSERMIRAVVEPVGESRVVEGRYGTSRVIEGRVLEADGEGAGGGQEERMTLWQQVTAGEEERAPLCASGASEADAATDGGRPAHQPSPPCALSVIGRVERSGGGYMMRVGAMTPIDDYGEDAEASLESLLPQAVTSGIEGLREGFKEHAEALLPQDTAALVLGMTYGDDSGLRPETQESLKTSGLTHLTAVSGANVALVFLLGVHAVRWTRCPRPATIGVGLVAVGGYVVLVGPEPSVLRAAVMGLLGGVTLALGRGGAAVSALWVSVVWLLCADRHLVGEPGFILSVLATAGIVLEGPVMCRALMPYMPKMLADSLAVSAVAGLWCGPYLVWMTEYWAPFTLLANLLVAPVVPGVTLTGLLALCLQGSATGAALTTVAGWGARWVELVGVGAASLPASRVEAGAGPWPVLLTAALALATTLLVHWADPLRRQRGGSMPDPLALSLDQSSSSRT